MYFTKEIQIVHWYHTLCSQEVLMLVLTWQNQLKICSIFLVSNSHKHFIKNFYLFMVFLFLLNWQKLLMNSHLLLLLIVERSQDILHTFLHLPIQVLYHHIFLRLILSVPHPLILAPLPLFLHLHPSIILVPFLTHQSESFLVLTHLNHILHILFDLLIVLRLPVYIQRGLIETRTVKNKLRIYKLV